MALTAYTAFGTTRSVDLDLGNSVIAVLGASGTFFAVEVDNTGNDEDVYLKIWDQTSVTLGTTTPNWVYRIRAGKKRGFLPSGLGNGVALSTGLAAAVVTAGGTGGTTAPVNDVAAKFITS